MKDKTDILMILIGAREKILKGWCQDARARKADGEACLDVLNPSAVAHCIEGAVEAAANLRNGVPAPIYKFVDGGVIYIPQERQRQEQIANDAIRILANAIQDNNDQHLYHLTRLVRWNDRDGRTQAQVLDLVDRTIASLMMEIELEEVKNEPETVA